MDLHFNEFNAAYLQAPDELQAFIDSGDIGAYAGDLLEQYKIPSEYKAQLTAVISNLVLQVGNSSDITAVLQPVDLPQDTIEQIQKDVAVFLDIPKKNNAPETAASSNGKTASTQTTSAPNQATPPAAAKTEATQNIPSVRTMQSDYQQHQRGEGDEPVHTAPSQSDILTKDKASTQPAANSETAPAPSAPHADTSVEATAPRVAREEAAPAQEAPPPETPAPQAATPPPPPPAEGDTPRWESEK